MDELKTNCLAVAQEALKPPQTFNPTSTTLSRKLENLLQCVEACAPEELGPKAAEFVFFPLHGLLQHESLGDRSTELLFECLTALCKSAWRKGSDLQLPRAQQLLAVTTYLLCPEQVTDSPSPKFLNKPLSYHAAAFKLFDSIFCSISNSDFTVQISRSPVIVQIISLLLDAINFDGDSLDAQISSINCLETIYSRIVTNPEHLALILPKAISRLARVVKKGNKRHYLVKKRSVECITRIFVLTMGDQTFPEGQNRDTIRNEQWINTTLENLQPTIKIIEGLQKSMLEVVGSKATLLQAIYRLAQDFLTHLEHRLANNSEISDLLINIVLLTKSQSIDLDLSCEADKFLRTNDPGLTKKVQARILDQLIALPSTLTSANESTVTFELQVLTNAIQLAPISKSIRAILDAIGQSMSLKLSNVTPKALSSIRSIDLYDPSSCGLVQFKDIGLDVVISGNTQALLANILELVGSKINHHEVEEVCGNLTNQLRSIQLKGRNTLDSIRLLWIVGNLIRGVSDEDSDFYDVISYCFEDIESNSKFDAIDTGNVAIIDSLHTAMACYVIGEVALKEKEAFDEHLVDLIFPVFALIGHPGSQIIREQASVAISKIAYACGYESPQALAIANKDYLIDGWSMQLNTLNMSPGTFESLASLIFISGDSIIPYLDDVFQSLFVLIDKYQGYSNLVKGTLTVFGALTASIKKSNSIVPESLDTAVVCSTIEIKHFEDLVQTLRRKPEVDTTITEAPLDLTKLDKSDFDLGAADRDSDDDSDAEESDNDQIQDEPDQAVEVWKYNVPQPTYMTIKKIADYCDRMMTHDSSEIRMATIVLVTELMPFLAINKDMFLPLIHKTWPEVSSRVLDKETYVVEQSFRCLGSMALYAKDFMTTRVDKLWPRLIKQYSATVQRKWPQFAPETRVASAWAEFFAILVEYVPDISLATLETGIITFRPAFKRGKFAKLREKLETVRPHVADLCWVILLDEYVSPANTNNQENPHLQTIEPVYSV